MVTLADTRKRRKPRAEKHSAENPAVESGMSGDVINIPDNVLFRGIAGYSSEDQEDLTWLFGWAGAELKSRRRLCEVLGYDWSTIIRVTQGKYPDAATGGKSESVAAFMQRVRELRAKAAAQGHAGFVETVVTRKIFDLLDYALAGDVDGGHMAIVVGGPGRSKTQAFKEWARRNNHGKAVYIDCPESGGQKALMREIAKACRINQGRNTFELRNRCFDSFHRRRILLIDEVARLLPHTMRGAPTVIEFIRRLHDVTNCAVALSATHTFNSEMASGAMQGYFEQLIGRLEPLYLPDKILRSESEAACRAFNPRASQALVDLAHRIANEPGRLRVLFGLLRKANALAQSKNVALAQDHLAAAWQHRQNRNRWNEE